jgi:hypothetical protein
VPPRQIVAFAAHLCTIFCRCVSFFFANNAESCWYLGWVFVLILMEPCDRQVFSFYMLSILRFYYFVRNRIWKKSNWPPNYWGWFSLPPQLWNGLIYPLNFAKPAKSPPRAVLDGGFATVIRYWYNNSGFCPFLFYLFRLNLWKIIVNHKKIIKWKIQFCWTPH